MSLPSGVFYASILLAVVGLIGPNPWLSAGAAIVLWLGCSLLWRPGETPVLLFIFGYQWLQISLGLFYAGWLGLSINDFSEFNGNLHSAAVLSLIGLLTFCCGIRLGAGAVRSKDAELVRLTAYKRSTKGWFQLYMIAWFTAAIAQLVARFVPSLSQPLLAVAGLEWAFFVVLTYSAFTANRQGRTYWLVAFALELISSIGGYFSDFKTVFIFALFGLVAARVRFAARIYVGLAVLVALVLIMGVAWTAIKADYRDYVSGGERAQVVTVGFEDRLSKMGELISELDGEKMSKGVDGLMRRIAYLDFFGAAINYVPSVVPYTEGAIWSDAIIRPFTPRLFFPGKTVIDDSDRTSEYTGLTVAGTSVGASISIGYMGETYIDFGPYGMMPVLAAFGYFLGLIYRYLLASREAAGVLGMGFASAVLEQSAFYETSITKMFGTIVVMLLVAWLLIRFVIPAYAPDLQR